MQSKGVTESSHDKKIGRIRPRRRGGQITRSEMREWKKKSH